MIKLRPLPAFFLSFLKKDNFTQDLKTALKLSHPQEAVLSALKYSIKEYGPQETCQTLAQHLRPQNYELKPAIFKQLQQHPQSLFQLRFGLALADVQRDPKKTLQEAAQLEKCQEGNKIVHSFQKSQSYFLEARSQRLLGQPKLSQQAATRAYFLIQQYQQLCQKTLFRNEDKKLDAYIKKSISQGHKLKSKVCFELALTTSSAQLSQAYFAEAVALKKILLPFTYYTQFEYFGIQLHFIRRIAQNSPVAASSRAVHVLQKLSQAERLLLTGKNSQLVREISQIVQDWQSKFFSLLQESSKSTNIDLPKLKAELQSARNKLKAQ